MTDILIFESDLDFANALRGELTRNGCDVSVVSDATEGLQQAAAHRPDLILLCTELPRMNGFSVCNRLKRNPELSDVPVIIMSANASEETFQQHRNLTKKRAQDYVHKPIAIGEMLDRVGRFVQLSNGVSAAPEAVVAEPEALDELDLEDMEEIVEEGLAEMPASQALQPSEPPDPGVAAAASSSPPPPPLRSSMPAAASVAPPGTRPPPKPSSVPAARRHDAEALEDGAEDPPAASSRRSSRAARRRSSGAPAPASVPAAAPVPSLSEVGFDPEPELPDERVEELERSLSDARAKLEAAYVELEELRSKGSSGNSKAREILDLREALNNKEKELLDLRDQLTRRDKELLASKDAALDLERASAAKDDALIEMEKRLHASERAQQAAIQDREQANKRVDGVKRKLDKTLLSLEDLTEEKQSLQASNSELDGQLKASQQHSQDLQSDLADAEKELAALEQRVEQSQQAQRHAEEKLAASEATLERTQAEVIALTKRLALQSEVHENLRNLLAQAAGSLSSLDSNE